MNSKRLEVFYLLFLCVFQGCSSRNSRWSRFNHVFVAIQELLLRHFRYLLGAHFCWWAGVWPTVQAHQKRGKGSLNIGHLAGTPRSGIHLSNNNNDMQLRRSVLLSYVMQHLTSNLILQYPHFMYMLRTITSRVEYWRYGTEHGTQLYFILCFVFGVKWIWSCDERGTFWRENNVV